MGGNLVRMIRQGRSFSGHEQNCVYLNTGQDRFANVSAVTGLNYDDDSRAAGRVDWDFDGDIDLWTSNRNAPAVRFFQNNQESGNHFVALRLLGTRCNRDAIGAKVELRLKNDADPLVRNVVAGDGYLTQSSKWLHFGLGNEAEIESVRVRWPGSDWESVKGVQADRHYTVQQDQGLAKAIDRPLQHPPLMPEPYETAKASANSSVFAVGRLPVPRLEYANQDGQELPVEIDGPLLLILWASWCQPCVEELSLLTEHSTELRAQGIRVLALSVDRISETGNEQAAREILAKLSFPFAHGFATDATLNKLQLVHDQLFGLQKPLPAPSSFLISSQKELAAVYRGTLDVDVVLNHSQALDADLHGRRSLSVPFQGRWAGKVRGLRVAPLVIELARAGYLEDASEYVQRVQNRFDRLTILDLVVRLGVGYYQQNRMDYANLHFQMARKIDPKTVLPELRLGKHLQGKTNHAEAAKVYRSKRHPLLQQKLLWLMAASSDASVGDPPAARQITERFIAQGDKSPETLDTYATSLAALGQFPESIEAARKAQQRASESGKHRLADDIGQRIQLFSEGKPFRLGD